MNLHELEKAYDTDFITISTILKKQGIKISLEHLDDIPEQWVSIIDKSLSLSEPPKSEKKHPQVLKKKPVKKARDKSFSNNSTYFYAYVKFIGDDKKHAFIKRLDDINNIGKVNLRSKDENDYKLQEDCSALEWEQLILCEEKSKKYNIAKIKATFFEGMLVKDNEHRFIDFLSLKSSTIINITTASDFNDEDYFSVATLYYNRKSIVCKRQNMLANEASIIPKVKEEVLQIISKPTVSKKDALIVKAYKATVETDTYFNNVQNRFEQEIDGEDFSNLNQLETFIAKWHNIDETLVTYANLKQEQWFLTFFEMWLNEELPSTFWDVHIVDAFIQFELNKVDTNTENIKFLSFESLLKPIHLQRLSEKLPIYLKQDLKIDSIETYDAIFGLVSLTQLTDKKAYFLKLKESLTEELQFEFWLANRTTIFPKEYALKNFSELEAEVQDKIIEHLENDELLAILPETKELSNSKNTNRLFDILKNQILDFLKPISFDIESDTESIFELAWNEKDTWKYLETTDNVKNELGLFKAAIDKSNDIILGHNIIDFDCPILEKEGVQFNTLRLWDTLLIELLINTKRKSYALATKHNAKDDANLTLDFFINQVSRILKTPEEELKILTDYLPEPTVNSLIALKDKVHLNWLSKEELNQRSSRYFRPEPKKKGIVEDLEERLSQSSAKTKLIIGCDDLKTDVLHFEGIRFSVKPNTDLDFAILDERKLKDSIGLDKWLKSVLITFVSHCKKIDMIAYWGNLPTLVRIKLQENTFDIYSLFTEQPLDWSLDNLIFLSVDELYEYSEDLREHKNLAVFVVQPDLISVTQKQFLKDFDLDFFKSANSDNYLWLKFSGGQSFVPITKKQCESLDITVPKHLSNFWIEKYLFGKYRAWGSYNWEALLDSIDFNSKEILSLDSEKFQKDQTNFARINVTKSNSMGVVRFNPESVYRSRYWVFQKELVRQTITPGKLTVLLIQRQDELEVLEAYFRSLGYFVPNNASSLGRRLELLYSYRKTKKILIATIQNISKVIKANYLGELNVVIDSFSLIENFYVSKGSIFFNALTKESNNINSRNSEEILGEEVIDKTPLVKDTFLLLKLHLPQISQYRNLLFHANPNHKLWILDPRVNDYPDLSKLWNARSVSMNIWQEKDNYEDDVKLADKHFTGVKPITDLPFELEETKQILCQVFLGNDAQWYDYQEPYLDVIIPGKTDLLVTLPTGGGKSLLFQAPALFKSTFTNRLSIVVTPLKALMEDQVDALWNKGFYGSVEYLNSDRSTDTQLIYRALAGGEIALLFVTPERFRSQSFKNALNVRLQSDGGLEYIVFDEAHCVSQWGHEFRPDYFNCAKEVYKIKTAASIDIPLLLFSATVSEKIYKDFNRIFS